MDFRFPISLFKAFLVRAEKNQPNLKLREGIYCFIKLSWPDVEQAPDVTRTQSRGRMLSPTMLASFSPIGKQVGMDREEEALASDSSRFISSQLATQGKGIVCLCVHSYNHTGGFRWLPAQVMCRLSPVTVLRGVRCHLCDCMITRPVSV